jgi:hypothetical protein
LLNVGEEVDSVVVEAVEEEADSVVAVEVPAVDLEEVVEVLVGGSVVAVEELEEEEVVSKYSFVLHCVTLNNLVCQGHVPSKNSPLRLL